MTDPFRFHLSQFVSAGQNFLLRDALGRIPYFPDTISACLIVGPERCGKTSILFNYAVNMVSNGKSVTIVCAKQKLSDDPPLLPEGASPALLERIKLRYLSTVQDLQKYAAAFHLLDSPPDALLVDDVSSFFRHQGTDRRSTEMELVKCLAMLHEAVTHAKIRRQGNERSFLMHAQQTLPREQGADMMCLSQLQYTMAGHTTLLLEAVLPPM